MGDKIIQNFIAQNTEEIFEMLRALCAIPAPSHAEQGRAEYCKKWLEMAGAKGVSIDSADNVIFPFGCEGSDDITVFAAHTDTVFPDTEPMPYKDDGEKIYSPGVADDTTSVVVLLMMAKFFIENNIIPQKGILFVCNSCEEGLGNLKGTRRIFSDYAGRIGRFITFDSNLNIVADRCVGSHRYEVEVKTEGGHSFGAFGNDNAIAVLSEIINEIYKIEVPSVAGSRTTYNVGTISGGTSVNTIAQNAKMLCEYRSDNLECLAVMQRRFAEIFAAERGEKIEVHITKVGDRPCSSTKEETIDELRRLVVPTIEDVIGEKVTLKSSSTDCNIPLSLGIPALCVGVNTHSGIHTREEWVDKASILVGLEVAIKLGEKFIEL